VSRGGGRWWNRVRLRENWCNSKDGCKREFRNLALVAVSQEGVDREEVKRKLVEFGKLFNIEVVVVCSLG